MVNVLIVDDSHFVCRTLASLLNSDPDIHVVGTASNGEEALKKVHELDPDVVTLDVEMPKMNGLAALKRIMAEKPCPVIMVSSLTKEGAETTLKALELGALDFVPKLSGSMGVDFSTMGKDLITRVKAVARKKAFMRLVFSRKHLAAENAGASSSAVSGFRFRRGRQGGRRFRRRHSQIQRNYAGISSRRRRQLRLRFHRRFHRRPAGGTKGTVGPAGKLSCTYPCRPTYAGGLYRSFCSAPQRAE